MEGGGVTVTPPVCRTSGRGGIRVALPLVVDQAHPARLRVGVIGAGRVGAVLGAALGAAGHQIMGAYAVSSASLERAASLLPGVPIMAAQDLVQTADLILLAVPDDALAALVEGIARTCGWQAGQIVVHTGGRSGTGVLEPARAQHALPLALHPAMTFTGTSMDLDRLRDCVFGSTCADELRPIAEALVMDMGGEVVWVAEGERAAYHCALAHAANHLVTLIAEAREILNRATGTQTPDRVLGPLTRAALDNALRLGDSALTGPVARGDVGTVESHLRELDRLAPDIRRTYLAMARATALRALDDGRLSAAAAEPLLHTLADQEPRA